MQKGLAVAALAAESASERTATVDRKSPTAEPVRGSEPAVVLNPFNVTTQRDHVYKATNPTSGTRLDTEIKDLPFAIEVITSQSVKDTGATSLRHALNDNNGAPIILDTAPRWTVNVFAHDEFKHRGEDAYVRVNRDNLLDDQKHYGLLWAPGGSASVRFGPAF